MLVFICYLSTLFNPLAGDTTIVFENTADTLMRPFHFYTEEYAAFQANDSSDYQVIYVTEPVYDSPYMLHYSLDKHVGRITQKHNTYIQERKLYAA